MCLERGFTLIEILIALFIFTVIALITSFSLNTILTSQARLHEKNKVFDALETTLILLSHDLQQTVKEPFKGEKHALTFTHFIRNGVQETTYQFQQHTFTRSHSSSEPRLLLTDVLDVSFDYLDSTNEFQKSWLPHSDKPDLPKAVRVSITLKEGGRISEVYPLP